MRALVCHAPRDLRLEDSALDPMGAKELLVRVAYGGICGSSAESSRRKSRGA